MKNFKKFSAAIAATLVAASISVPMMASLPVSAADITITGISTTQTHNFEIYQVFTGDLSGDVLSNLKWGSGVTATKYKDGSGNAVTVTSGAAVDENIVNTLTGLTDAVGVADNFTLADTPTATMQSEGGTATISGLADGYYIVKDVTNLGDKDDSNSAWIVQVAGSASIDIKNAKPTVDKQVYDNDDGASGDNNGWFESADHAINESFQFKLTATIPADKDFAAYETYKVVFNDTMSDGVTFESIESVKVNGSTDVPVYAAGTAEDGYKSTATANQAGGAWTITIEDLLKYDTNLKDGSTIEVIYNAHLNENAIVHKDKDAATDINTNNNTVSLSYSNNPDATGSGTAEGKTTEDTVWVFTYEVDNTKYKNAVGSGNKLKDAGFRLYKGEVEVGLIYDSGKGAYRPVADGETAEEMKSATDGKFNIIGLDAGTYTLKETTTPEGYNTCAPITIEIKATHSENAGGTAANLSLTDSKNMSNDVINKSGSTLPGTGGIGTTVFYIGGGCMVALAGVFLITKKRMGKKED